MNTSSEAASSPGRIAGIDYGTVRIGIALSDPGRSLASPYENYTRRGADSDAERFRQLTVEEGITLFVVGLPIHLDGRESQKSIEAREFGKWLEQVSGLGVEYFDERFTSSQAEQYLSAAGLTSKRRKKRKDMLSAQIMLTAYLESRCQGQEHPGPLDDGDREVCEPAVTSRHKGRGDGTLGVFVE